MARKGREREREEERVATRADRRKEIERGG